MHVKYSTNNKKRKVKICRNVSPGYKIYREGVQLENDEKVLLGVPFSISIMMLGMISNFNQLGM